MLALTLQPSTRALCAGAGALPVDTADSPDAPIDNLAFSLHKHESGEPGPTLLVVAGIQGDEPGGFTAASLLVTHYRILKGGVWIVPNLNFISIVKQRRGVHGDLNRKFSRLAATDPEFDVIAKIKSIILDPDVDVVLNMHDGSGYYRPEHIDAMRNPHRWGQSIIIDQERIDAPAYGELDALARKVVARANENLHDPEHRFHVKNTHTRLGDAEMEKTLTYFAINNGKPAFGLEASKSFPTALRAYYHLRNLEAFMHAMGIEFVRDFEMNVADVAETIERDAALALYDNRIFLDLRDVRARLGFIPMKKDAQLAFSSTNPLITVVDDHGGYSIFYGNRCVTQLHPQFFDYDAANGVTELLVDGQRLRAPMGARIPVQRSFQVAPREGVRVNVIGYTREGVSSECGHPIAREDFLEQFSVDTAGDVFRVEFYNEADNAFSGMVLVDFSGEPSGSPRVLPPMRVLSQAQ